MKASRHATDTDKKRLRAALEYQDIETLPDVLGKINSGDYVLLKADDSTLTVCVIDKALHVCQYGGKLSDIKAAYDCLIRIAEDMGLSTISLRGRAGWDKVLKPLGFTRNNEGLDYVIR